MILHAFVGLGCLFVGATKGLKNRPSPKPLGFAPFVTARYCQETGFTDSTMPQELVAWRKGDGFCFQMFCKGFTDFGWTLMDLSPCFGDFWPFMALQNCFWDDSVVLGLKKSFLL